MTQDEIMNSMALRLRETLIEYDPSEVAAIRYAVDVYNTQMRQLERLQIAVQRAKDRLTSEYAGMGYAVSYEDL